MESIRSFFSNLKKSTFSSDYPMAALGLTAPLPTCSLMQGVMLLSIAQNMINYYQHGNVFGKGILRSAYE